jgi:putative protease
MTELLAPAGSREAFAAAIANGADAVYLGGKMFGARAYADNFSLEELKEMIEEAHLFGVKVYVTVNTIIYDDEFPDLIEFLDFLYQNHCDAIIVQDLGVANLARKRYPQLKLHASTQMNIHSLAQVKVLEELGFSRVVLARELSLAEISEIKKNSNLEIEVFVHGALCVSCSGNCYLSSIIGKRSGNRGRCAQPCRLEYSLGKNQGYLLSTKDLNTLSRIPELLAAGIDSLKIEGRMKRPEYVACVVGAYRQALDKRLFNLDKAEEDLRKIFNRQFTQGFLFSEPRENIVNPDTPNHIGIEVGRVLSGNNHWVQVRLSGTVNKGDSLRLVGGTTDAVTLNQFYKDRTEVTIAAPGDIIRFRTHLDGLEGAAVYLTTSAKQLEELRETYRKRVIPIKGRVYLENQELVLEVSCREYRASAKTKVEKALNNPVNERLEKQIRKTADTFFTFSALEIAVFEPIFLSVAGINELRRQALALLKEKMLWRPLPTPVEFTWDSVPIPKLTPGMKVKVRNLEQLEAVLAYPVAEIYVTDEKLLSYQKQYPEILFRYVVPRWNQRTDYSHPHLLSSDLSLVKDAATSIYMNVTNIYALNLLEKLGAKTIGLSLELSREQIRNLLEQYRKIFSRNPNLEIMVYGRYELMMLRYCPIRRFLGCENCKQEHRMQDRKGYDFILCGENCLIKVLNAKKIHLKEYIEELSAWGLSQLLDFTDERPEEVRAVCDSYFLKAETILKDFTYGHFKEGVL